MRQLFAKSISTDILIPLYSFDLNYFFIVFKHLCFLNPMLEEVAVVFKAYSTPAKPHHHHFWSVVHFIDKFLEKLRGTH